MIHIAAISQIRLDTDGRAYCQRKRAEGKKPLEGPQLVADAEPTAGPRPQHGPGRARRDD